MASVNFPKSFDMSSKGSPAPATPQIVRFRSDNSSYVSNSSSGDTIRIEIPTGGRGQYLFPNDSFFTCKIGCVFNTSPAGGSVLLDTCVYSLFKRIRILQGSNVLVDTNNCGRLWNALRDIQVTIGSRSRDEIALMTEANGTQLPVAGYFAGKTLADATTYDCAFVLPAPLLGSFTKSAVPLNLMGASSLFLELELNPSNVAITTRVFADADASIGTCTTAPVVTFTLSEIFYSAKMCQLDDMYQQALMSVYQGGILLPSVDYIADQKVISSGATIINEKLAFNKSSANAILWWLTPSTIAAGTVTSNNYADGVSTRLGAALKDYTVAVSGNNLLEIRAGTSRAGLFFGSQALLQIHRVFNMSVVDGCGILNELNFCSSNDTYATNTVGVSATASSKRFVGAYSLERYDADSSYQSGMNLVGQDVRLFVNFDSATTISHNLYCYALIDVAYEIRDGVVSVRS